MFSSLLGANASASSDSNKARPVLAVSKAMAKDGLQKGLNIRLKYVIPEEYKSAMEGRKLWIGVYKEGGSVSVVPAIRCEALEGVLEIGTGGLEAGHAYVCSLREGEVWPLITTYSTSDKVLILPPPPPPPPSDEPEPEPVKKTPPPQFRASSSSAVASSSSSPPSSSSGSSSPRWQEPVVPSKPSSVPKKPSALKSSAESASSSAPRLGAGKSALDGSGSSVPRLRQGDLSPRGSSSNIPRAASGETSPRNSSSNSSSNNSALSSNSSGVVRASSSSGIARSSEPRAATSPRSSEPRVPAKATALPPLPAPPAGRDAGSARPASPRSSVPEKLIVRMLEELSIRTRMHNGREVPLSFTGISLVSWLQQTVKTIESREDAVKWGRAMMKQDVFFCADDEQEGFADVAVPYVLNLDHPLVGPNWARVSAAPQQSRRASSPSLPGASSSSSSSSSSATSPRRGPAAVSPRQTAPAPPSNRPPRRPVPQQQQHQDDFVDDYK